LQPRVDEHLSLGLWQVWLLGDEALCDHGYGIAAGAIACEHNSRHVGFELARVE
jgi:hypothetical protein